MTKLYISNEDDIFGYETGPSLINRMGLTTQVPKNIYISTNNIRVTNSFENVELVKPTVKITKENYKYLQILDVISNKYNVPFEASNSNEIIKKLIKDNGLNFEKLLYYSRFYKDNKIFKKLAFLAEL